MEISENFASNLASREHGMNPREPRVFSKRALRWLDRLAFSAREVFIEGLARRCVKPHFLSLRQHLWIGLALGGAILVTALLVLILKQRAGDLAQLTGPQERPIHLAALDRTPDLPAYLLTLCGPEVLAIHGGKGPGGAMPDWFREAGRALAEKGLVWPRPQTGLDDPILLSNVREHESQAMELLATDPMAAVAKMERLIRLEEEKFKTRSWRAALAESAASHQGRPEPGVYQAMLDDIPGQYFEMVIGETLENHPDPGLAEIAIAEALKREPGLRMTGLAAVIRTRELAFDTRENAARTLAGELRLSFSVADVDGRDWTFEVGERLRTESSDPPQGNAAPVPK